MPFQQSLSSIFLPSTSIYASIDQPPRPTRRSPQPNQVLYSAQDAPQEQAEQAEVDLEAIPEIDPFSSVTPSVLSPQRNQLEPLPPQSHSQQPIREEDPFYDDLDGTVSRSRQQSQEEVTPTSVTASGSTSSRVIGSKSLMGLLGGTTYRSANTYRSTQEVEEEEDREADEQDHLNYRDEGEGDAQRRQR